MGELIADVIEIELEADLTKLLHFYHETFKILSSYLQIGKECYYIFFEVECPCEYTVMVVEMTLYVIVSI